MKNSLTLFVSCIVLFCCTNTFAFFCPSNFNQIDMGYTKEKVIELCGKPDKEETKDGESSAPQQWDYYIPQPNNGMLSNQAQGTLRTSIAFDGNKKVVNITINGISVSSRTICGRNIEIGTSRDDVKAACGTPNFVNTQTGSSSASAPVDKITTLIYNSTPPVTLTFTNGVLTGR